MPRLTHRNPGYRKHKASGLAIVTSDGVDPVSWQVGNR
jgi:hypothetical protein